MKKLTPPDKPYQICSHCVMDTTDPDISFDDQGHCNHCRMHAALSRQRVVVGDAGEQVLSEMVRTIKAHGRNKEYNCILGLSGGVDSSFVAYQAKRLGLKPLVAHFDNGWNSETSVRNIENIVRKLDFDLHTFVLDWEEFRDLQLSFLRASVVDIEMLTDHAIMATMFKTAIEYGIKYILSGTNVATESIMPATWFYPAKWDIRNIKGIHRQFSSRKIKMFPTYSFIDMFLCRYVRRMKYVEILNCIDYNRAQAIQLLEKELGWKDYGAKHYESVFTKFYQAYILPEKFNIDKRRAHYSSLICSGQMTRPEALDQLTKPLYDPTELGNDKTYVNKKLELTADEFYEIMQAEPKAHYAYPTSRLMGPWAQAFIRSIKKNPRPS